MLPFGEEIASGLQTGGDFFGKMRQLSHGKSGGSQEWCYALMEGASTDSPLLPVTCQPHFVGQGTVDARKTGCSSSNLAATVPCRRNAWPSFGSQVLLSFYNHCFLFQPRNCCLLTNKNIIITINNGSWDVLRVSHSATCSMTVYFILTIDPRGRSWVTEKLREILTIPPAHAH